MTERMEPVKENIEKLFYALATYLGSEPESLSQFKEVFGIEYDSFAFVIDGHEDAKTGICIDGDEVRTIYPSECSCTIDITRRHLSDILSGRRSLWEIMQEESISFVVTDHHDLEP